MMLFFYLYANSFQDDLGKATVSVDSIKVLSENKLNKRANLDVRFVFQNPTSITLTVSTINYELFVNGKSLGQGHLSTEDIPEAGRPILFAKDNATIPNTFELVSTDGVAKEYSDIVNNQPVKYEIKGQVTIQSFLTAVTKDFDVTLG